MKNIVAIGDIHGRSIWKQIVKNNPNADLFVFIGDYFDSFNVSPIEQKQNFREILSFKRANPTKVVLLFGNHEFHYLRGSVNKYAGYQATQQWDFQELLEEALKDDLMTMCYTYKKLMFTHAGVTKTWANNNEILLYDVENEINYLFKRYKQYFDFQLGLNYSDIGDDVNQGPIWIRPNSLKQDRLDGYIHIVGHTSSDDIDIDLENNVIVIDTLKANKYLLIHFNDENEYIFEEKIINN